MNHNKRPRSHELFLAGGLSGAIECLTVQPFDITKTRMQLADSSARPTVAAALCGLVREGGVARLYRGLLPELLAIVPKSSAMYTSYEAGCRALCPRLGDTPCTHALAGFIAAWPEALVVTPFQVVKVRLQTKELLSRYRNCAAAETLDSRRVC